MFALTRKKDQQLPSPSQGISGTYVKVSSNERAIYSKYGQSYPHSSNNNTRLSPRGITALEISESYLSKQDEEIWNKKTSKGARKKLPFLQRRKKNLKGLVQDPIYENSQGNDENDDNDCNSDITTYDEGIPIVSQGLSSNIESVPLDIFKNTEKLENEYAEEAIDERLKFIVGNYRAPPPYPGSSNSENGGKSLIHQLLQERSSLQVKDNESMINYCQVDVAKGLSVEDLTKLMQAFPDEFTEVKLPAGQFDNNKDKSFENLAQKQNVRNLPRSGSMNDFLDDKLVMRTINSPTSTSARKEIIINDSNFVDHHSNHDQFTKEMFQSAFITRATPEMISEIYPRDYDIEYDDDSQVKSQSYMKNSEADGIRNIPVADYPQAAASMIHPERDYDLPGNEESVTLPELDYHEDGQSYPNHFRERSETFVPPSPYMQAEIPEWLVLYANASPDLDEYLKWDMFRIQELDCWQTMLKRLYMKELGQVVSWFEEYRECMQQEIERREKELGINRLLLPNMDIRMTKTDV